MRFFHLLIFSPIIILVVVIFVLDRSGVKQYIASIEGDYWYEITDRGRGIGYLNEEISLSKEGISIFSLLDYSINESESVSSERRLLFSASPPFNLIKGTERKGYGKDAIDLSIDLALENKNRWEPSEYLIRLTAYGESSTERTTASINFLALNRLSYAVFSGLDEENITENHQIFDFSTLSNRIVESELVKKSSESVMIESTVDSVMHRLTYSNLGILERSEFGSQYSIQKSTEREVIQSLSNGTFVADSKEFPKILLDRMLADSSKIKELSLKLDSNNADDEVFRNTLPIALSTQIGDYKKYSSSEQPRLPTNQTATFLTRHPKILRILEEFQHQESGIDNVSALIAFIHELVDYEDIPYSQSVLETLDSGRGDCTEFADLFTTLARSIGIPTQTVFGIVYETGGIPKMAFHAWNEIEINEKIIEIDPTWQQIPADGSHIRLSQKAINSFQNYPEKEINYSVDYAAY